MTKSAEVVRQVLRALGVPGWETMLSSLPADGDEAGGNADEDRPSGGGLSRPPRHIERRPAPEWIGVVVHGPGFP